VTEDPEAGRLDPETETQLRDMAETFQAEVGGINEAGQYREHYITRRAEQMRAEDRGPEEIAEMEATERARPWTYWIDAVNRRDLEPPQANG
jgi:hypothetical protein